MPEAGGHKRLWNDNGIGANERSALNDVGCGQTDSEQSRLDEVNALDAPNLSDARIRDITHVCARVLGIPTSFVSIITANRQHIRGCCGPMNVGDGDRETAFCNHVISSDAPMIVRDALDDPRFRNNPYVTGDPYIRFYAGVPVHGRNGEPVGTLCVADTRPHDLSNEKQRTLTEFAELVRRELLRHEELVEGEIDPATTASRDPVTGLPPQRLIRDHLDQTVRDAADDDHGVSVLWVDIEYFRDFVLASGQDTGDQLLRQVATRLAVALPEASVIGRWQEDKFVCVVPDSADPDLHQTVHPVMQSFQEPFQIDGEIYQIAARIGISVYPRDAQASDELVRNAQYTANTLEVTGHTSFAVHDRTVNARLSEKFDIERRLHTAIETESLNLVYQPKLDATTGLVTAVEALMRWQDPHLGTVSPGTFIPLAESSGLIHRVGRFALEKACFEASRWDQIIQDAPDIAVNVSAQEMQDPKFPEYVADVLQRAGLPGSRLILEITESALIYNQDQAIRNMNELGRKNVGFAIDDFGTGYASFRYIQQLPLKGLKLDRSFVRRIADAHQDARIVEAIIGLGHTLDLTVVAEGVETSGQETFLVNSGCDLLQGFRYSKPLPTEDFQNLLVGRNGVPSGERLH